MRVCAREGEREGVCVQERESVRAGGGVEIVLTLILFISLKLILFIILILFISLITMTLLPLLTCLCLRCFYLLNYPDTLTRPPTRDAF